jgi:hypothetical protein
MKASRVAVTDLQMQLLLGSLPKTVANCGNGKPGFVGLVLLFMAGKCCFEALDDIYIFWRFSIRAYRIRKTIVR